VKGIHLMVIVGAIGAMQVASHSQGRPAAVVDDAALRNADARTADWITHGRTYGEQRFSPLTEINDGNVSQLGLAWSFQTEGIRVAGARARGDDVDRAMVDRWRRRQPVPVVDPGAAPGHR
jgi:glucose dehydrogenase